jgi:hypothetical protein
MQYLISRLAKVESIFKARQTHANVTIVSSKPNPLPLNAVLHQIRRPRIRPGIITKIQHKARMVGPWSCRAVSVAMIQVKTAVTKV